MRLNRLPSPGDGVSLDNNGTDTTDGKWMFIPVCSFHGLEGGLTPLPP